MGKKITAIEMLMIQNTQAFFTIKLFNLQNLRFAKACEVNCTRSIKDQQTNQDQDTSPSASKNQCHIESLSMLKKETFILIGQYIDCKIQLNLWPQDIDIIFEDRILTDALKLGVFGQDQQELKQKVIQKLQNSQAKSEELRIAAEALIEKQKQKDKTIVQNQGLLHSMKFYFNSKWQVVVKYVKMLVKKKRIALPVLLIIFIILLKK